MKKIVYLFLAVIFSINSTNAESFVNSGKNIAFDISGVAEYVKSVFTIPSSPLSIDEEAPITQAKTEKKLATTTDIGTCEVYDALFINSLVLDSASLEATLKIDKIQDTIENEMLLRDGIFENTKNLSTLQKNEKVIFREMKKQINEARDFYKNIDDKLLDINAFLDENNCEKISVKKEKDLDDMYLDSEDKIDEESIFRKQFSSTLKDKISVLQKEVREVKSKK